MTGSISALSKIIYGHANPVMFGAIVDALNGCLELKANPLIMAGSAGLRHM